jgi:hypothetical protein
MWMRLVRGGSDASGACQMQLILLSGVLSCLRLHDALLGLDGGLHLETEGQGKPCHVLLFLTGELGRLWLAHGLPRPEPASQRDLLQRVLQRSLHLAHVELDARLYTTTNCVPSSFWACMAVKCL